MHLFFSFYFSSTQSLKRNYLGKRNVRHILRPARPQYPQRDPLLFSVFEAINNLSALFFLKKKEEEKIVSVELLPWKHPSAQDSEFCDVHRVPRRRWRRHFQAEAPDMAGMAKQVSLQRIASAAFFVIELQPTALRKTRSHKHTHLSWLWHLAGTEFSLLCVSHYFLSLTYFAKLF